MCGPTATTFDRPSRCFPHPNHEATLVDESMIPSEQPDPLPSDRSMRHDLVSEQAVEVGIRLQEILSTRDAATFLKTNVIDINVALRVLLRPAQRRKC